METKYPPPNPSTAQTMSGNPLWPWYFTPVCFYQRWVVSKKPVQLNMNPMSSNADGVGCVYLPGCAVTDPSPSVFSCHVIVDERHPQLITVSNNPIQRLKTHCAIRVLEIERKSGCVLTHDSRLVSNVSDDPGAEVGE